jgi:hypothetical protein
MPPEATTGVVIAIAIFAVIGAEHCATAGPFQACPSDESRFHWATSNRARACRIQQGVYLDRLSLNPVDISIIRGYRLRRPFNSGL